MRSPRRRRSVVVAGLVALGLATGCASPGPAPEVGPDADAALALGREVWTAGCARCHGAGGGGGVGPRLAGRMVERFPDPAAEAELIVEGRQGMPPFGRSLSTEEIDAVVRYTREIL